MELHGLGIQSTATTLVSGFAVREGGHHERRKNFLGQFDLAQYAALQKRDTTLYSSFYIIIGIEQQSVL